MFCRTKITNIESNPEYLISKFYGSKHKSITEDMVCFQQAACAYIKYYKSNNMQQLAKSNQLDFKENPEFAKIQLRLQKYLDRMNEVVQCKAKKYVNKSDEDIFNEIDKILACQLHCEDPQFRKEQDMQGSVITSIPIIDIILNIDLFSY